ncbi:MAG: BolA/IbaG family iron-sulfur metabolism protein [Alphaproteobacteria bacterium]|nr:BolA/IbaG family iron-sulfur metabolism protein [Alphaproteobacteria bacterium]
MSIRARIETKLTEAFQPQALEIIDESERHQGHAGHSPGGETHFRVRIVSPRFEGMSRLARQRLVYQILDAELKERVHALSLHASAPAEVA